MLNFEANISLMQRFNPRKKRREFHFLSEKYIRRNYIKNLYLVFEDVKMNHNISRVHLEFMLYVYDYEFFTVKHIAEKLGRSKNKLYERTINPLKRNGYLEDAYHAKNVDAFVNAMFEERSFNDNRITLSAKGRLLVQRVYRKLEGEETINFP